MDANLTPFLSKEQIAVAVQRLAGELDQDYGGRSPLIVGVLKGGFIFTADLVRQLRTRLRGIEFMQVTSYGSGMVSSGRPRVVKGIAAELIVGQHVVVVEDIVDTGITTSAVSRYLRRHRPASLEVCALLDKPARRQIGIDIRYVGISIPDRFVVGYGLDLDQRFRELPEIYVVENN